MSSKQGRVVQRRPWTWGCERKFTEHATQGAPAAC